MLSSKRGLLVLFLGMSLAFTMLAVSWAQAPAGGESKPPSGYRRLAPGVLTTIPAPQSLDDTVSSHNVVEIRTGVPNLDWDPYTTSKTRTLLAMATDRAFRRPAWNLEFNFKPVRYIYVDVPVRGGKVERKLIWYMVYRVNNRGGHLKPVFNADGSYSGKTDKVDHEVRFLPEFTLESPELKKAYMDRIIPVAMDPIRRREDPNRKLLNSVEMGAVTIPVSKNDDDGVWGVATWQDVDLRIDFFSIFIKGLSSGYRWTDPPKAYKAGDPPATGRMFTYKTLELSFWRPGDEFEPDEEEIRFGVPGKVDYGWVYR